MPHLKPDMNKHSLIKSSVISLTLIITICQGFAQSSLIHNMDNNTLVNFSEIVENLHEIDKTEPGKNVYNITLKNYGYLLVVKYLGEYRDILIEKKEFLNYIFKTIGVYDKTKDLFSKEVLVETDIGKSWFSIQNELFGYWVEELKERDSALIYIRVYGSMGDIPENKWIFTINAFNSEYYNGLWEEALKNFNDGKDTIGLRCLNKMISIEPNDGRNYAMLGYYYTILGKRNSYDSNIFIKADSLFSIAEKMTPDYSYQYFQRAILKFYMKEYLPSWSYTEKARSFKEKNIEQSFVDDLESKLSYKEFLKRKK